MSYQIGQKVFAVHFTYRSATLHRYFYTQPFLFCDEVPVGIKFLELKVVSTHSVQATGANQSKESLQRGYLLQNKDGHLFACQYSTAAKEMKDQEGCQRFNFHDVNGTLGDWLISNPYDFHSLDGALKKLRELIEVTNVESIHPDDPRRSQCEHRRLKMVRFYNQVIVQFREEFPNEPADHFELLQCV